MILGSLMCTVDTTIVNVALLSLARDLHATLADIQWVVTAYLLALAAVTPVTGWAARRFGARRVYLIALVLFTVGSALCGFASSAGELIIFRVLQGLGGGVIGPVGQMIIVKAAGSRRLARVMGAIGLTNVVGPMLGPAVGGLLIDSAGWRWIFFVTVPVGVVAVVAGLRKLPAHAGEDAGRFDLLGLALVATGLVLLTYGLSEASTSNAGAALHVVFPLLLGVALVGGFVVRALRIDRPLLDVRLYANKAYSAASLTMFCCGAALFGGMILMPLYYQTVRHQDAVYAGLLLIPRGVGAGLGTWAAGRLTDRLGGGAMAAAGVVITLASTVPLGFLGANTSFVWTSFAIAINGFGIGLALIPVITVAYRVLSERQIHDATPQMNILLRVGGSIGTAISTVILQGHLVVAGRSLPAQAAAFGATFWWVVGFTATAVVMTGLLVVAERRHRSAAPAVTRRARHRRSI